MRVTVKVHVSAQEQLREWIEGRDDDPNSESLNRVYLHELIRILEENAGEIAQAVCVGEYEPKTYRWQYTDDVAVEFMVKTARKFPIGSVRRIVITGFQLATDR
jgi:hypothetical protein